MFINLTTSLTNAGMHLVRSCIFSTKNKIGHIFHVELHFFLIKPSRPPLYLVLPLRGMKLSYT